jgi:hypothetical protein
MPGRLYLVEDFARPFWAKVVHDKTDGVEITDDHTVRFWTFRASCAQPISVAPWVPDYGKMVPRLAAGHPQSPLP